MPPGDYEVSCVVIIPSPLYKHTSVSHTYGGLAIYGMFPALPEPDLVTYKMVTNDTEVASLFFINYLDGQVTVNGKLTGGKTYEMYAEATEDNTTRKAEM